eukprot:g7190.t1
MVEPAEDEVDRLLRSGHDALPVLQPWWRSKMNSRSIMIRRIQKTIRGYLQYSKYTKGRWSVICIQSYVRMQYRRRKYRLTERKINT